MHRYLYAYANPTVYVDLDGYESVNTMIDNAAEGCGAVSCAGWALLKGIYNVSTLGFAAVHDPVRDAYDEGKISGSDYAVKGIGGGLAVAGVSLATARVGGSLVAGATSVTGRVTTSAVVGAGSGAVSDAATQGVHISVGVQEEYDVGRTVESAALGAAFGGGSAALVEGAVAARGAMAPRRASAAADAKVVGESSSGPRSEAPSAPMGNQRPSSHGDGPDLAQSTMAPRAPGGGIADEIATLRRIASNNANGAAARSASGFEVRLEAKGASGGRGLGANQTVDRVANEYAAAVQQAHRILKSNRAPQTAWERRYRAELAAGKTPDPRTFGNALQQVADDLLNANCYAIEAGAVTNQRSWVSVLRPKRPDVQVPMTPKSQGVIDLTTPGQAPKLGKKYTHPDNEVLINVLYKK